MTAAGLVVTAVAFAQPPNSPPLKDEPAKESLEQLLAKALQQSPEVQIAEAKLREAEANLRQTRLQLAQKLVETYNALESQRTLLSKAEAALDRAQKLKQAQQISPQELDAAVTLVLQSKNQLVQSETALNAMTGRLPAGAGQFLRLTGVFETAAAPALADDARRFRTPRPEMAGRMRSALNKTLKVKGFDGVPLSEVVNFVREQAGDVPMLNNLQNFGDANVKVDFKGETTMGGFLQILGDVVPDLRVSVRDYGFLIGVNGLEPHDAMPLAQFWPEK
jgi:outer membrane protein TolC